METTHVENGGAIGGGGEEHLGRKECVEGRHTVLPVRPVRPVRPRSPPSPFQMAAHPDELIVKRYVVIPPNYTNGPDVENLVRRGYVEANQDVDRIATRRFLAEVIHRYIADRSPGADNTEDFDGFMENMRPHWNDQRLLNANVEEWGQCGLAFAALQTHCRTWETTNVAPESCTKTRPGPTHPKPRIFSALCSNRAVDWPSTILSLCDEEPRPELSTTFRRLGEELTIEQLDRNTPYGKMWATPLNACHRNPVLMELVMREFVLPVVRAGKAVNETQFCLILTNPHRYGLGDARRMSAFRAAYEVSKNVARMAVLFAPGGPWKRGQWSPVTAACWKHLMLRSRDCDALVRRSVQGVAASEAGNAHAMVINVLALANAEGVAEGAMANGGMNGVVFI